MLHNSRENLKTIHQHTLIARIGHTISQHSRTYWWVIATGIH